MDVLIVDDDAVAMLFVKELLTEQLGVKVSLADDGDTAELYLRAAAKLPKLIVLDLIMPRVGGRAVLETLRADPALRSIPVVVTSAFSGPPDRDPPVVANLKKPYNPNDLLAVVRTVLSRPPVFLHRGQG